MRCTICREPLHHLDLEEGATDHAGCAGAVMEAARWAERTPTRPDPFAHLDERRPCPECGRLMGRGDAELGRCVMCRRIALANAKHQEKSR